MRSVTVCASFGEWRKHLENTDNLHIWQDEATEILTEQGAACGVRTIWGAELRAKAVVVTAGTFLRGLMHIGRKQVQGAVARNRRLTSTESINALGIRSDRMKTGTPVRIDKRSVHLEEMEEQPGETDFHRFSFISPLRPLPQLPCWTCETNAEVHEMLRSGLADSPLYNGQIQSIGPRYCPSIETKIVTFPDRDSHPLFLEPEGLDTNELYPNGFSSSLPMDVQIEALKRIPCFRDVTVFRPGYAIEYDFFRPYATAPLARIETGAGSFSLPDRSMVPRATRKRRAGFGCGCECSFDGWRRHRPFYAATRRGLHWRTHRRFGDEGCRRTLPHVYVACRIPHSASSGQCRHSPDALRRTIWFGFGRAFGAFPCQAR